MCLLFATLQFMNLKEYFALPTTRAATLAEQLDVSPSFLSQMAGGTAAISEKRAVLIEGFTNGLVCRQDLFPNDWQDIWPELVPKDPLTTPRDSMGSEV
jgi:DNA-binding transcriptional regulator YdaS (Cro superfamily)